MNRTILLLFLSFLFWHPQAGAQGIPALSLNLKKPEKFENKKLGYEKTDEKKFTVPRRFIQNTVTKFNWRFNAKEKLAGILERAKIAHQDDYTQLLSFYNYSLDFTAQQKTELDSVIYKANAGILLHDLRNSWVDNLYMLMGQAYYFRKDFDTAYTTFQYINYAFAPKEKDGYDIPIGSNAAEGGNAFTISTHEKKDLAHRIWSTPPSRNESFIWQIRTYLARDAYAEAAGLIEILKHDPQFPERLRYDLYEVQSLWFYQQNVYDSAAVYLEKALPMAEGREETARWNYLAGQLYEKAGKAEDARSAFGRAMKHTLNPVLEVYARLNYIRQNKADEKALAENLDALRKMARRDRYLNYRDIIYYAAAQMQLEAGDTTAAMALLLRSTRVQSPNPGDPLQKSRSFLMLADLSYSTGDYQQARRFYDSVSNPAVADDSRTFSNRKNALGFIGENAEVIARQDSLQKIAGMPDAEREKYIRKLVRQLRKQQGLNEEEPLSGGNTGNSPREAPPDLFGNNEKGQWYFYNNSLKAKGFDQFKSRWGNRPNVDNWNRIAAIRQATRPSPDNAANAGNISGGADAGAILSYESLLAHVPLTPVQMQTSNDSIEQAQLAIGKTLLNSLEDYRGCIKQLTVFLDRFPYSSARPEALFYLYYCYRKTNDPEQANAMLKELQNQFPGSAYAERAAHPNAEPAADSLKTAMTRDYDRIYNLFIEGDFSAALQAKKTADSLYSSNYWTPQLLYIESVYYIRQRQDDSAKKVLNDIVSLYNGTAMAEKARLMIDVLGRRKQIEQHLRDLKIERPEEMDSVARANPIAAKPAAASDSAAAPVTQSPVPRVAPPAKPAITQGPGDSTARNQPPAASAFVYNAQAPHLVAIVLQKVDPVFAREARNAFDRYNRQTYYNKPMTASVESLSDSLSLVLLDPFANEQEALDYAEKTGKIAGSSIVPWLPPAKFSFLIISRENLDILKNTGKMDAYKQFLNTHYPNQFVP